MAAVSRPQVHNTYKRTAPPSAVYIGRGSPFGNPFVIGKDGTRDDVCDKFAAMLAADEALKAKVVRELKGRDLVCFCAPHRCHGDALLAVANGWPL